MSGMRTVIKTTNDFVAFAELVSNPSKMKQVADELREYIRQMKVQNDEAAKISDQLSENQRTLDQINNDRKKVSDEAALVAADIGKLANERQKLINGKVELAQREDVLTAREVSAQAHEDHNKDEDARLKKLSDKLESDRLEIENTRKSADAEHEKWRSRNAQFEKIASNG